jgi:recombination protein RecT
MASNSLTLKSARDLLDRSRDEFSGALANRVDPEMFIRVAHTAMHKTPELLNCTPHSIIMSLLEAAQLGLVPNGVMGEAYLIPYKGVCTFQPGYRGLITLARRSGAVRKIMPRSVYRADQFNVEYGLDDRILHRPELDPDRRGDLVHVYAVAKLDDDEHQFFVMNMKDVARIRAKSHAANKGPWVTDFEAMAWKTVIKQLFKYLPASTHDRALERAIDADNRVEVGDVPQYDPAAAVAPVSRTEQLRGRVAAQLPGPSMEVPQGNGGSDYETVERDEPARQGNGRQQQMRREPEEDRREPPPPEDREPIDGPSGNPVVDFMRLVNDTKPKGGDASEKDRARLREVGADVVGEGTEDFRTIELLSNMEKLGRRQVLQLIGAASAALEVRAAADADAEDEDGPLFQQ